MTDQSKRLTFDEICRIEPSVLHLYNRAKAIKDDKRQRSFCANDIWLDHLKPLLMHLVGWSAGKAELRTSQAYDLAYDKIYGALPNCRNCFCEKLIAAISRG
jgi:hypothetical protein